MSESFGAAIIIAGDRSDHELQANIRFGASQVYNVLLNFRGFPASRIYFLSPSTPGGLEPNANAESTFANIQYAFTTWASANTDTTHGLVVYLFDHGGTGAMAIPGGALSSSNIDGWLDQLETNQGVKRVVIIYEACESGSFASQLSQANRIVVMSTDATHSAYASSNWAVFSESFWGSITTGNTIGDAFVAGVYNVATTGHGTVQYPLIDDNHDAVAHQAQLVVVWIFPVIFLPSGGDGNDALNTKISGYDGPLLVYTKITHAIPHVHVLYSGNNIPVWVTIANNTPVRSVSVQAIPPNFVPPEPSPPDNISSHVGPPNTGLPTAMLLDHAGSGNYSGSITGIGSPLPRGDYMLNVQVTSDAGITDTVCLGATVGDSTSPPPDTTAPVVAISAPADGTTISGVINITASAQDDTGLDRVELYVDNNLVENASLLGQFPYPDVLHALDTSTLRDGSHTILAKTFDTAGLTGTAMSMVTVQNATTPAIDGYAPVFVICICIAAVAWIVRRRKLAA